MYHRIFLLSQVTEDSVQTGRIYLVYMMETSRVYLAFHVVELKRRSDVIDSGFLSGSWFGFAFLQMLALVRLFPCDHKMAASSSQTAFFQSLRWQKIV